MATGSTIEELPGPSSDDLDAILDVLGVSDEGGRAKLRHLLQAHARSFSFGRWLFAHQPSVHEDAKRAADLALQVRSIQQGLDAMQAEFVVPLSLAFSEKSDRPGGWHEFKADLAMLESHLEKLGSIKFAKKQPDRMLRNSVGGLILLLEKVTGNRAVARKRNSTTGREPELASAEAKAIGLLLRSVDPDLQTTTLVNIIEKIRSENRGQPLDEFSHQLVLGGTITPH